MQEFDVMVIGTGSGLEVVEEAVERDLKVAIVEEGPFGGTCLNRGCIPSKMLIHSADVMETIKNAEKFGIKASVHSVDWDFIVKRAFHEIDHDAANIEKGNASHPNITVFKGTGKFVGRKIVEVNGQQIKADTVLIAAGTRPSVPDIPGLAQTPHYTSDDVMRLPKQPKRMVVLGGGFIAAEMTHFFGTMGTDVTLVHRRDVLLRQEDEEIAKRFTEGFGKKHKLLLETKVNSVRKHTEGVAVEVEKDGKIQTLLCDALLVATGRAPNTDILDVAKTGVKTNRRGYIKVDDYMETNVKGVWALGDIVGKFLLKHNANLEADYAVHNMFNPDSKEAVDYKGMAHAVFSSPQVAGVGFTEQEAKQYNAKYNVSTYSYGDTAYGASIEDRDGLVKVLADKETGEILGCHIVGTEAATLIQEAANAMRTRQTTDAITQAVYVHPALPEVMQRAFASL